MEDSVFIDNKEYEQVIFEDIQSNYTDGLNLECSIRINDFVNVDLCDFVGLYRVGWKSSNDYLLLLSINSLLKTEKNSKIKLIFEGKFCLSIGIYHYR
jgi:hypothetical protein